MTTDRRYQEMLADVRRGVEVKRTNYEKHGRKEYLHRCGFWVWEAAKIIHEKNCRLVK